MADKYIWQHLKEIECESPSSETLISKLKPFGQHCLVEDKYKLQKDNPYHIIMGKVTVASAIGPKVKSNGKFYIIEVLQDGTYGKEYPVCVVKELCKELGQANLSPGDYIAMRCVQVEHNCSATVNSDVHSLLIRLTLHTNYVQVWFMRNDSKEIVPRPIVQPTKENVSNYVYKTISQLSKEERFVNVYGILTSVFKQPIEKEKCYYAIIIIIDESCITNPFKVHIFYEKHLPPPKLEVNSVVRLHRMKVEKYYSVLDGRIFSSRDMITCVAKGDGTFETFTSANTYSFTGEDEKRIMYLLGWHIAYSVFKNPDQSVAIKDIAEEGTYNIICKVLSVNYTSSRSNILTVTDGTPANSFNNYKVDVDISVTNMTEQLEELKVGEIICFCNIEVKKDVGNNNYNSQLQFSADGDKVHLFPIQKGDDAAENIEKKLAWINCKLSNKLSATFDEWDNTPYLSSYLSEEVTENDVAKVKTNLELPCSSERSPVENLLDQDHVASKLVLYDCNENIPQAEKLSSCNNQVEMDTDTEKEDGVAFFNNTTIDEAGFNKRQYTDANKVSSHATELKPKSSYKTKLLGQRSMAEKCLLQTKGIEFEAKKGEILENSLNETNITQNEASVTKKSNASTIKVTSKTSSKAARRIKVKRGLMLVDSEEDVSASKITRTGSLSNMSIMDIIFYDSNDIHKQIAKLDTNIPSSSHQLSSNIYQSEVVGSSMDPERSNLKEEDKNYTSISVLKKTQALYNVLARIQNIYPALSGPPTDIVSGICLKCSRVEVYSKIKQVGKDLLCSHCLKDGSEVFLKLAYLLQLEIADDSGESLSVIICDRCGNRLFSCSATEYLQRPHVQNQVYQSLKNLQAREEGTEICLIPLVNNFGTKFLVWNINFDFI